MTKSTDLFYEVHVFCCTNEREPGHPRGSCKARGGIELRDHLKARAKQLGLRGRVRINSAACLDRCELGPCMVIYPEGVWYSYATAADANEILERHIVKGEVVERLVLAKDQTLPRAARLALTVVSAEALTPSVRRLVLAAKDGGPLPAFAGGAHINLVTGAGVTRSYSLANDPATADTYEIAVKRETAGAGGSRWLHDHLQVGDTVEASQPANNFALAGDAKSHLLIAGGIGITPLLSMARSLKRTGGDFRLHVCARSVDDAAFADVIRDELADRATFHFDGGDPARGIDLDRVLADRAEGAHLYLCGPTGLMDAVLEKARELGWPEAAIHREFFHPHAPAADRVNEAFTVRLASSGREFAVPADKSILEVLRQNGVTVESSCEGGTCGTCRTPLVGGVAEHRDEVLTADEKTRNQAIMVCVSRAAGGETLVLDR